MQVFPHWAMQFIVKVTDLLLLGLLLVLIRVLLNVEI